MTIPSFDNLSFTWRDVLGWLSTFFLFLYAASIWTSVRSAQTYPNSLLSLTLLILSLVCVGVAEYLRRSDDWVSAVAARFVCYALASIGFPIICIGLFAKRATLLAVGVLLVISLVVSMWAGRRMRILIWLRENESKFLSKGKYLKGTKALRSWVSAWLTFAIVATMLGLAQVSFRLNLTDGGSGKSFVWWDDNYLSILLSLVLIGSLVRLWGESKPDFWDAVDSVQVDAISRAESEVGWRDEWKMVAVMLSWLMFMGLRVVNL